MAKPCLTIYCNGYSEATLDNCLQLIENTTAIKGILDQHIMVITLERPHCNKRETIEKEIIEQNNLVEKLFNF